MNTDTHGLARTLTEEGTTRPDRPYLALSAGVRAELVRADLTERQFRVAEFFVSATLDRGRQFVKGVRLEELGTALGLKKGNVSEAIAELQECGLLQVYRAVDGVMHRLLPDSVHWFVNWRYNPAKLEGYLQALDVASGHYQKPLLEPEPDLRAAMAEVSMEKASCERPTFNVQRPTLNVENKTEDVAVRFSLRVPRASHNRETPIQISSSSSSNFGPEVEGVRDLDQDFSSMGISRSSKGRSDCTEVENTVKVIGEVPDSGTGEQAEDNAKVIHSTHWTDDGWLTDKLRARCVKLFEELWEGKTKLARDFCALYSIRPSRARELIGVAVDKDFPAKWLNVVVAQEFAFKKAKAFKQEHAEKTEVAA